jgi:putative MATE family efflux protein
MGASAAVSRAIGAGDRDRVRRLTTDSLFLAVAIVGVTAIVGMLTIEPLFRTLGAGSTTLPYIRRYMSIWYPGAIFVVVPMVGNNCIRATGDTRTPGLIMVIGAGTNAILDPLLIFGLGPFPALGIQGAALATLIGRSTTFTISILVLAVREKLFDFHPGRLARVFESWKSVLYVGIPMAATRMIVPIGAGIVTRIVSEYGPNAVAGYGVATRLEFFSLAVVNALAAVMGPFIGQNIGAKKLSRVREGYTAGMRICAAVGGFFFIVFLILARPIASVFTDAPDVIAVTTTYVRIVSLVYALQGIYLISVPALNVLRMPLRAAGLGVLEMFVLVVPLSLFGSWLFGLTGVFSAIAVSYAITGIVSTIVFRRSTREVEPANDRPGGRRRN